MMSNESDNDSDNDIKIGNMFTLQGGSKLGNGSFGTIYKGYNNKTKEEVAIKIESINSKTPQLQYESKILKLLQDGGEVILI
jgi:casein kinase I family protein HRR25